MTLLLPLLLAAAPSAADRRDASLSERYVRMRAATIVGDQPTAAAELAALLSRAPGDPAIAGQAYRQAILGGDEALALRAAHAATAAGEALPDAPLLFAIDAIRRRDWSAARAQADALAAGKLFAFVVPGLRAWIAVGAGDADPLVMLAASRTDPIAAGYYPAQRALLLLAQGRVEEGAAAVRALPGAGARLKLLAAAALLRDHRAADATALLVGDDDLLAAARRRIAAGRGLDIAIDGAGGGVGELLGQLALDLARQQLSPVALVMARLATFAAPGDASAWIAVANLLAKAGRGDAALVALDHVERGDPFRSSAENLRVAILVDRGDRRAALDAVLAETRAPGAGALQWGRLGDVYLSNDRPADAAGAYARAIDLDPGSADAWALWLQRGAALEQAGDWPGAKVALEKARALAPAEPAVLNHLGYAELTRREDVNGASAMIAQASRLRPDDPAITDSLGWAHYLRGDVGTAVALLERAAGGDPAEATINEHLGDAYWSAGRRREARYAWRAALVTAEAGDATRLRAKLDAGLTGTTASP